MTCPACRAQNDDRATTCATCGRRLPPPPLGPGSLISGRYQILATLGKGGMGMVYKARDRMLDETVAIKVLRPEVASAAGMTQRFVAEIKMARQVSHRNVCRIHEYGEDGRLRYISMAFVDGVDLKQVLRERGALPPAQAFDVALQVAEGVQAIHDEGIIHRDLKTSNLMMDPKGLVRLMDFGIAKQWDQDTAAGVTAAGQIIGSPEYMSPEQARGEKLDVRSDVYALGIVVYELFTGRTPFQADTPMGLLLKHIQEPPRLEGPGAAPLPPPLVPVLQRALAKQRDERFASAREMGAALREAREQALGPYPTPVPGVTPAPGAWASGPSATPVPTDVPSVRPTPVPRLSTTAVPAKGTTVRDRAATLPPVEEWPSAGTLERPRTNLLALGMIAAGTALATVALVAGVWFLRRAQPAPAASVAAPTTAAPSSPTASPVAPPPGAAQAPATTTVPVAVAPAVQQPVPPPRTAPAPVPSSATTLELEGVLVEAEAAFGAGQYDLAVTLYAQALALDPASERARLGRDLAAKAAAQGTPRRASRSFVAGQTRFSGDAQAQQQGPAGFVDDGAIATRRLEPARTLPGRLLLEVEPPQVRPGDPFTVKVYLVNEGAATIPLRAEVTVTTTVNGRDLGGPLRPLVSDVKPHERALLLHLSDYWKTDTTTWALAVTVKTLSGETYKNEVVWK